MAIIELTDGPDTYTALASDDEVLGKLGNDTLTAFASGSGNTLRGGGGNDKLYGASGPDTLYGGLGVDIMVGGAGNDIYFIDNISDQVIEAADSGEDNVFSSISYVLGNNVDGLYLLGDQDLNGTGNDLNNYLWGNKGANVLFGGTGLDYLMGDAGKDILYGGQGIDWLYGGDGDDMILGGRGDDYLSGGEGEDELQGNMQDDTLYGDGGADLLLGGQGTDFLSGGTGNDTLNGALGSDILTGDDGKDTFAFSTALSSDAIDTIIDFSVTDDNIMLSSGIFTQLTQANIGTTFVKNATGVAGAGQYLIYNTTNHTLSYDADANGAGAAVMVALDGSAGNTMDAINANSFVIV